jgi:hypothetical protein
MEPRMVCFGGTAQQYQTMNTTKQLEEALAHGDYSGHEAPARILADEVRRLERENAELRKDKALTLSDCVIDRQAEVIAELRKDKARLDWLADPKTTIGNVVLPREYIMNNLDCMRSAIDAAMEATK